MRKPKPSHAAIRRYRKANYDRIEFMVSAGKRDILQKLANEAGAKSLSAWIAGIIEKETGIPLVLTGELPALKNKKDDEENEGSA